jgi:hypothetical protein
MAIVKTIADPQGPGTIDAYAKYTRFSFDVEARQIRMTLAVYRSQEARDAVGEDGRPLYVPITVQDFLVNDSGSSGPTGPLPGGPNYAQYQAGDNENPTGVGAQIYGFLKAFTAWSGAEDA